MKENKGKKEGKSDDQDAPGTSLEAKVPYPKSVFLIIGSDLCLMLCHVGTRTCLSLYFRDKLRFNERTSKIIFHGFIVLKTAFPFLGAVLADSFLGKFRVILWFGFVYLAGLILLELSAIDTLGLPDRLFCGLGLVVIAFGSGSMHSAVIPFGGDQYQLPQQKKQLAEYFTWLYLLSNILSLFGTFFFPHLRRSVHCFGQSTCFPAVFGIPGVLMVAALILFVVGRPMYKIIIPEINVVYQVTKCIVYGIKQKIKSKEKVDHWLDRCEDKFDKTLIKDIKRMNKVLVILTTLPMFDALYSQQGSGWVFQASRLDGDIGFTTILPDQIQFMNAFFVFVLIPTFNYGIYPLLTKCHLLTKPLQRMATGGLISALSFVMASLLFYALEKEDPVLPSTGQCTLRVYNLLDCPATLSAQPFLKNQLVKPMGMAKVDLKAVKGTKTVGYKISGCDQSIEHTNGSNLKIAEKAALLCYMTTSGLVQLDDDITKDENAFPKVRTLVNKKTQLKMIYWLGDVKELVVPSSDSSLRTIAAATYKINKFHKEIKFKVGGVYTVLVSLSNDDKIRRVEVYEVTKPNKLHILYQVPQIFVLAVGEVMFAITCLQFAYMQAPKSMTAMMYAAYIFTASIGNIVVVIIESSGLLTRHTINYLVYGGLLIVDMIVLIVLAIKYYTYVEEEEEEEPKPNVSNMSLTTMEKR